MPANPVIRVVGLDKQYETTAGSVPVLRDISLTIGQGEFVAIMGPSGSGKSTFMNILGCLDAPTRGTYLLDGDDTGTLNKDQLARLRNRVIGFVFQGFNLLSRASLQENVALPLVYAGVGKAERRRLAGEMLEKVGLGAYRMSMPNRISGGQQQRVAISRALINHPRVILADEPTGNLDAGTSREIMVLFKTLNEEGTTIVLVTHEPGVARYAGRLVTLVDGRITQDAALQATAEAEAQP